MFDALHGDAAQVGEFLDFGVDFGDGAEAEDADVVFADFEEDVVDRGVGIGGEKYAFALSGQGANDVGDSGGLSCPGHSKD